MTSPATELLELAVAELGGSHRAGQHAMVVAVDAALDSGEHLLVQAGTGTGKSLGYLVPVVRHAAATGDRVVISTATLALQRQLLSRDLPLVLSAVGPRLPRTPEVALLKGWHNYLCRHRLAGGYPEPDLFSADGGTDSKSGGSRLGGEVLRLREWAEETATGDRDDLVPGVSDRAWQQVSVTALDCLGNRCPLHGECFADQARVQAHAAEIVVTNHSMLGIATAAPGVLPEHQVLVVDEAHELPDRITSQATVELSAGVVERAARFARRVGCSGDQLGAAGDALRRLELGDGRLTELTAPVADAVAGVREAARALLSELRVDGDQEEPQAAAGRKMASAAALTVFEVAERMLSGDSDVLWCRDGRLFAAPLDVAHLIRTQLFAGRTAILTSATLKLGSFLPLAGAVGLAARDQVADDEAAAPARVDGAIAASPEAAEVAESPEVDGAPWRGIDVGSPFDHARRGILYVARHLPAPGREPATEAQLDEIEALITAAGGATLGLFSSRRAAVTAAEGMRERLRLPVLCQGDDTVPTLVRDFVADDATCLFGTLSLWQGIDAPGATCRLVIIDRIPFPRPDDPIISARAEAVTAAGGNGFLAVSVTRAALLLAQGAGRLLRTHTDQGVVAVLDPRLVTARYGGYLVRSLPPFWATTDREAVLGALRRSATGSAAR